MTSEADEKFELRVARYAVNIAEKILAECERRAAARQGGAGDA
jgi:hypothetical protein